MKKLFSLLFIAGMLSLASCGGSETRSDAAAARDSAASAASAAKADSMLNKMSADTTHKMGGDSSKMAMDTAKKM